MGSVNVTMLTYPKNLEGSITILGEKGTVRIGGVAVNEIEHWEFDEPRPDGRARSSEASYETTSVYGFGHPLYYDNVIKTLRGEARARDRWPRRPEVARTADRDVPVGARRRARQPAAGLLSRADGTTIHPIAIVDEGAQLGDGCRVWHFVHICARRAHRRALLVRPERLSSATT